MKMYCNIYSTKKRDSPLLGRHQGLTWKSFFCSMVSCFVLNVLLVAPGFDKEGTKFG